ncbi:recombinase family protein [Clostridium perfringens]|uniref:recombinase family protein n=1 Tax=Clostridium perfringens TaxID=1502 RepID=UPI00224795A4|nr:recombinase family protein [Clostridium perfringens]MCX0353373.1 recombinase family protein [Clostridium perfringens]
MNKIVGYCRVSTKKQLLEGNGLEAQEKEILERYNNAIIYKEQFTGSVIERPVLNEVLNELQSGDMLVVTKLDRLARNTVEGIEIVQELFKKEVAVHVLNIGLLENTSMGKFFLTTLLAVAEMERNTIIERTQSGREIARTKSGYREGRPKKYEKEQLNHAMELLDTHSYSQVEKLTGISISTLTREKRKRKALQ